MKTAGSSVPEKTNERPGTRALVRGSSMSASKVRVVLNLIRNKPIRRAAEILQFTERTAADVVGKCLASAVANAVNNDGLVADQLFVSACYADEGQTAKRWRPRARGRATRIRKRSCHITIIVSPVPEAELERTRASEAARAASRSSRTVRTASEARRRRVEGSRQATDDAPETAPVDVEADETPVDTSPEETTAQETTAQKTADTDADAVDESTDESGEAVKDGED